MDEISFKIRNISVQEFSRVIASSGIPLLDMAANTADLGKLIASAISGTMTQYGLTIPELYIENISLPPAVEAALDKRTSMGIAGDLGKFTQYSAAEAMTAAAANPNGGGGMGAGLGMGMGMAMANQMQTGPWGPMATAPTPPAPPSPPAPPVEHVWHIAVDGAVTGPFSKAAMGRMVTDSTLSRESQVWTQGQDGWKRAEDVQELAQLFTVMPPPPPSA